MFTFDLLTIIGIAAIAMIGVVLFTLCRLRGCNKPLC